MISFVVALAFFLSEMLIFETVSWKGALSPMIVAGEIAWMAVNWELRARAASVPWD